jgi:hypothetical protein
VRTRTFATRSQPPSRRSWGIDAAEADSTLAAQALSAGHDFARVRVRPLDTAASTEPHHAADHSNDVRGMTVGGSIHLASSVNVDSPEGRFTLGHEAAHAIQQRRSVSGHNALTASERSALEIEANRAGHAASRNVPFTVQGRAPSGVALYQDAKSEREARWKQEWDTASPDEKLHFDVGGRPKGTPEERYMTLCPMYLEHGEPSPIQYIRNNIVPGYFFQFHPPVHKDVAAGLLVAQSELIVTHHWDPKNAPLTRVGGFVPRTQTGGKWSHHALGRAVDIDSETNPHLRSDAENRVISEVTGIDTLSKDPGKELSLPLFEAIAEASERFKERFNQPELEKIVDKYGDQVEELENRIGWLTEEVSNMPRGSAASKDDKKWRAGLEAQIKGLKRELKEPEKTYKLFSETLAKYEKDDAEVKELRTKMDQKWAQVLVLQAQRLEAILAGDDAERRRLEKEIKKATGSARKAETRHRRKAGPLRMYAEKGILSLSKDLVRALSAAMLGPGGFKWGGEFHHKDTMHFQK